MAPQPKTPTPEEIAESNERRLVTANREVAEAAQSGVKSRIVYARVLLLRELVAQHKWREAGDLLPEIDAEISELR